MHQGEIRSFDLHGAILFILDQAPGGLTNEHGGEGSRFGRELAPLFGSSTILAWCTSVALLSISKELTVIEEITYLDLSLNTCIASFPPGFPPVVRPDR